MNLHKNEMNQHTILSGHKFIVDFDPLWNGFCFNCCIEQLFHNFDNNNLHIHIYEVGTVLLNSITELQEKVDLEPIFETVIAYMFNFIIHNCKHISNFKENILIMESFLVEYLDFHLKLTSKSICALNKHLGLVLSSKCQGFARNYYVENIWQLHFILKLLFNYCMYSQDTIVERNTIFMNSIVMNLTKIFDFIYESRNVLNRNHSEDESLMILKFELFSFLCSTLNLMDKDTLKNDICPNTIADSIIIYITKELLESEMETKKVQSQYLVNFLDNNRFSYVANHHKLQQQQEECYASNNTYSFNSNCNEQSFNIHLCTILRIFLQLIRQHTSYNLSGITDIFDYTLKFMPTLVQTTIQLAKQGLNEAEKNSIQNNEGRVIVVIDNTLFYNGVSVIYELLELGINKDIAMKDTKHFAIKIIERLVRDDCNYISKLFALYEKSLLITADHKALKSIPYLQLNILKTFSNLSEINPRLFYHFTNYTPHIFHAEYRHFIAIITSLYVAIEQQNTKLNKRKFYIINDNSDQECMHNQDIIDRLIIVMTNAINFNPNCLSSGSLMSDIIKECGNLITCTKSIWAISYIISLYIPIALFTFAQSNGSKQIILRDQNEVFRITLHALQICVMELTIKNTEHRLYEILISLMHFLHGKMQYIFVDFIFSCNEVLKTFQDLVKALLSNVLITIKDDLKRYRDHSEYGIGNVANELEIVYEYIFEVVHLLLISSHDKKLMPLMDIFVKTHQNRELHRLLCQYFLNYTTKSSNIDNYDRYFQLYAKFILTVFYVYSMKDNTNEPLQCLDSVLEIANFLKNLSCTVLSSDAVMLCNLTDKNRSILSCRLIDYIIQLHYSNNLNQSNTFELMEETKSNLYSPEYYCIEIKCVTLYLACCLDTSKLGCMKRLLTSTTKTSAIQLDGPDLINKHTVAIIEAISLEVSLSLVEFPAQVCYENALSLNYLLSIFLSPDVDSLGNFFAIGAFKLLLEGVTTNNKLHIHIQSIVHPILAGSIDYWKSCHSDHYCTAEYLMYELCGDMTKQHQLQQDNILSEFSSTKFIFKMIFRVLHCYAISYSSNNSVSYSDNLFLKFLEYISSMHVEELIEKQDPSSFSIYFRAISKVIQPLNHILNDTIIIPIEDISTLGLAISTCLMTVDRMIKYEILVGDTNIMNSSELEELICIEICEPCACLLKLIVTISGSVQQLVSSAAVVAARIPFIEETIRDTSVSLINSLCMIKLKKKTLLSLSLFTGYWSKNLITNSYNSLFHSFILIYFKITNYQKPQMRNSIQCNSTLYLFYNATCDKEIEASLTLSATDAIQFVKSAMRYSLYERPSSLYTSIINFNIEFYSIQEKGGLCLSASQLQQKMIYYSLLCLSAVLYLTVQHQEVRTDLSNLVSCNTDVYPFMLIIQCKEILAACDVCLLRLLDSSVKGSSILAPDMLSNVVHSTKLTIIQLRTSILMFSDAYLYFNMRNNEPNQLPWDRFFFNKSNDDPKIASSAYWKYHKLSESLYKDQQQESWNQNISSALVTNLEQIHLLFLTSLHCKKENIV